MPDPTTIAYFSGVNCHYTYPPGIVFRIGGKELMDDDWRRLSGAPDNSRIEITTIDYKQVKAISILAKNPLFQHSSLRILYRNPELNAMQMIRNDGFLLKSEYQQQGIGLRSFAMEAYAAASLNIGAITAEAAGNHKSKTFKGWYAWPRMGYDAKLPPEIVEKLTPTLGHATTVLDLMESEEGRKFWKDKGDEIEMVFDLSKQSRSWTVLEKYMQEKGCQL